MAQYEIYRISTNERINLIEADAAFAQALAQAHPEAPDVGARRTDLDARNREYRDAVNHVRSRLIEAGTVVTVTGYGPIALQGREEDQRTLQGLAFGAQLRLGQGDTTTLTPFLDRENIQHMLTPMQLLETWQRGAGFVSYIYAKSWAIKEMNPETTDPSNPALWQ